MTRGTVPDKDTVIARLRASNDVLRAELRNDSRPRRAFWRGIVFGGLLTGAVFIAGSWL